MYRVEGSHWWYLGMETISRCILIRHLGSGENYKILDAGCGTGAAMLNLLSSFGQVVGLDLSPTALSFCRARGAEHLTRGSVSNLPFISNSFDLVASFDVLYARTVPNVQAALREQARVLDSGGYMLIRLPAYNWLRGRHDDAVWTSRRFTRQEVVKLLEEAGLKVQHATYANTFLFPLALVKRLVERIFPAAAFPRDMNIPPRLLNRVLTAILRLEAPLAARHSLPFGLSVFALAQKP